MPIRKPAKLARETLFHFVSYDIMEEILKEDKKRKEKKCKNQL
ncbi:hypothetical protein [Lactococcus lactis]|nr:hypothetical protein [Lactococcus lactis]